MNNVLLILILVIYVGCKDQVSDPVVANTDDITTTPSVKPCDIDDTLAPSLQGALEIGKDGSVNVSSSVSWEDATDNCAVDHYEVAIGTTAGGEEVLSYTNIGDGNNYKQYGLVFNYIEDYFYSVRAVDTTGNLSTPLVSDSWKIFSPQSLLDLVVWLDATITNSVLDLEGDALGSNDFSSQVNQWLDKSTSINSHDFVSGPNRPEWDAIVKGLRFNGVNQYLTTANHADINTALSSERTISIVIKTDNNIGSRQVIYEEGGSVRGINIYIENQQIHCGYWNIVDDGDGVQPYVEVSENIEEDSSYVVSYEYDYSNFVDASGVDGTVSCSLNGSQFGSVSITSRLFSHPGQIGLGAVKNTSYFPDGASNVSLGHFYKGVINEFLIYNRIHSEEQNDNLQKALIDKWKI